MVKCEYFVRGYVREAVNQEEDEGLLRNIYFPSLVFKLSRPFTYSSHGDLSYIVGEKKVEDVRVIFSMSLILPNRNQGQRDKRF